MPHAISLSAVAVAVLRFRVKGYRIPVNESRLGAFRELAEAGIMEPVPGPVAEYWFTEDGWAGREQILHEAEADLLGQQPHLPDRIDLSASAREALHRHMAGDGEVTDANRPAYRELARAGIMTSVGTFTQGDDCVFRFTHRGWERRFEFAGMGRSKESA